MTVRLTDDEMVEAVEEELGRDMRETAKRIRDAEMQGRRERIATAALQGLLANVQAAPFGAHFGRDVMVDISRKSIRIADALIEELDR